MDLNLIDHWVCNILFSVLNFYFKEKVNDSETFQMARKIIRDEGILSGGSSGAHLVGAMRAAKHLKKGQNCVVIFSDSIRNYLSKFLSDDWMVSNKFMNPIKSLQSIYPKNTFNTMAEYDPTALPVYDFQKVDKLWSQKKYKYVFLYFVKQ